MHFPFAAIRGKKKSYRSTLNSTFLLPMTWKEFIYWSEHKLNKKFKYATGAWTVIAFYPRKARNLNTIKESKRLTYFSSGILPESMFLDLYIILYINTQREYIKNPLKLVNLIS